MDFCLVWILLRLLASWMVIYIYIYIKWKTNIFKKKKKIYHSWVFESQRQIPRPIFNHLCLYFPLPFFFFFFWLACPQNPNDSSLSTSYSTPDRLSRKQSHLSNLSSPLASTPRSNSMRVVSRTPLSSKSNRSKSHTPDISGTQNQKIRQKGMHTRAESRFVFFVNIKEHKCNSFHYCTFIYLKKKSSFPIPRKLSFSFFLFSLFWCNSFYLFILFIFIWILFSPNVYNAKIKSGLSHLLENRRNSTVKRAHFIQIDIFFFLYEREGEKEKTAYFL